MLRQTHGKIPYLPLHRNACEQHGASMAFAVSQAVAVEVAVVVNLGGSSVANSSWESDVAPVGVAHRRR